ncbi:DUF498 domain protein [Rutstroemia sp. NJR-2017a WRK4]|nr:DUF498 domain protein [Rutstroemia sp. NJR-2017a WRK4]
MSQLRTSFLRPHPRPTILEIANLVLCPSPHIARPLSTTCLHHRSQALSPSQSPSPIRPLTHSRTLATSSRPPKSTYRGPASSETTQTDFSSLDVLGNTPAPSTSIDACLSDGFHLNSGVKVTGGDGVLLVGGEAFAWRPWRGDVGNKGLVNEKGQWEVGERAWGLLGRVWPRPGLGKEMRPLAPKTRAYIHGLGIRIEIQDTRNAAAQFNLLATERGVGSVAAALVPIGR